MRKRSLPDITPVKIVNVSGTRVMRYTAFGRGVKADTSMRQPAADADLVTSWPRPERAVGLTEEPVTGGPVRFGTRALPPSTGGQ